jgi:hypothetical protein
VTLLTSALIVLGLNDGTLRRWWSGRAFTTGAVAKILVVLITVLIINQILRLHRQRERSRATAAQIGVVLGAPYWRDRNLKYHRYQPLEPRPSHQIQDLLDYLDSGADPIFWG